ncbi:MAG: ABC1 kinase family protein [Candidatus Helarchaeota archaeon]
MRIRRLSRTYRNIKRYREILTVLLRYGFDDVLDRLKFDYYINLGKKILPIFKSHELVTITTAERLRMAMEELGPTFVKLGQMLSVRPDLVPESFTDEFKKLQDKVPPFPSKQAMGIVEAQLGKPMEQLFSSFDENPLAAASIAQVHRAVTKSNEQVVIKIQRPNIRGVVETDLGILFDLAGLVEKYIPESELYDPKAIVREFAKSIRMEMDFVREGRNIERFRRNFEDDDTVFVPRVHWKLTTGNILTMDFIDGIKVSELDALEKAGLDRKIIAYNGARATLRQIFDFGFFHADPHPGNIFVLPGNVIAPVDYGMMGSLDEELMEATGSLLTAIVKKDVNRIIRTLTDMGVIENMLDARELKLDLKDFLDRYYQVPLSQLDLGRVLSEITEVIRRHRIKLQSDLILMGKALVTEEGVGRMLDPDFDIITMAKPYVEKLMIRKLDPRRHLREFIDSLNDFVRLVKILPGEFGTILAKIKKGELNIKFEHRGLERLTLELEKASNRLSFSMIIAALIIGSSLIVQLKKGPQIFDLPVFGILGYFVAAILGLWLVIAIIRSGKL